MHSGAMVWTWVVLAAIADVGEAPVQQERRGSQTPAGAEAPDPPADWFFAGRIDARLINFKASLWLGYGVLGRFAVAAESYAHIDTGSVTLGGGLLGQYKMLDLRLHARYAIAFGSALLLPQETYDRFDIQSSVGPSARYLALEALAKFVPRLGPGWLRCEASLAAVVGVEADYYLMEARTNLVMKPPWVWSVEIGYLLPVTEDEWGQVGPNIELVGNPGRGHLVWRAGVRLRWRVYPGWEVRGMFMAPVSNPDNIGLDGGTRLELGLRFVWLLGSDPDD